MRCVEIDGYDLFMNEVMNEVRIRRVKEMVCLYIIINTVFLAIYYLHALLKFYEV